MWKYHKSAQTTTRRLATVSLRPTYVTFGTCGGSCTSRPSPILTDCARWFRHPGFRNRQVQFTHKESTPVANDFLFNMRAQVSLYVSAEGMQKRFLFDVEATLVVVVVKTALQACKARQEVTALM